MKTVKICCISDTHNVHHKIKMPECDMIIHAGDFSYRGEMSEVTSFLHWYERQEAKHKILVCGNHEVEISKQFDLLKRLCEDKGIQLLHNEHTVVEGLMIYGSPYSRKFGNWAYMADEADLGRIYDQILPSTNIVITHGPAYKQLDFCPGGHVGSTALEHRLKELPNLKLHVTGHIHESRGTMLKNGVLTVNAAICGIPYSDIVINPITVEIE
jgi:Icc-related predicted phosphoesterase